jgi:hypothetical protein
MPEQRQAGLRVWLDGTPVAHPSDWILQLEVEERADEASTFRMTVDMSPIEGDREGGDWDVLEHGTFADEYQIPDFRLLHRVTIEFSLASDDETEAEISATVIDGYITCVEPVFGESRVPDSQLIVSGLDASCLMHFETVTREWYAMTDAQIARELFTKYGFAVSATSIEDSVPVRERDRATLVQRCTDAEFLRLLARRNGFEVYLEPDQGTIRPGAHPGTSVVGHFHSPRPDGDMQPVLALFPRQAPSLIEYRARWESHQPTRIRAWHIDEATRRIQRADIVEPGYGRMGTHSRADVLEERLRTIFRNGTQLEAVDLQSLDVPHEAQELANLARADYRSVDWFVTGHGTVRCERYAAIVRSRRPIELRGAGHLLDGRWYVQAVRHRWGVDPETPDEEPVVRRYEADVTLVRNALGGLG